MNKLTEIKQSLEIREEMGRRDEDTICMRYLVALLEEKDKALAVIADENNWRSYDGYPLWTNDTEYQDPAFIARKALNTSSNNKGETI